MDNCTRRTVVRPDTTFVLHFNAFTHKAQGGYSCHVFEGSVRACAGPLMTGAQALAYLAAHPDTVVSVLHV